MNDKLYEFDGFDILETVRKVFFQISSILSQASVRHMHYISGILSVAQADKVC